MSIICENIDKSIQVQIPRKKSSQLYVAEMKCRVTSNTTHDILISKDLGYKNYKEICSGEPKNVNLGIVFQSYFWLYNNNSLKHIDRWSNDFIYGRSSAMAYDWEILSKFFSIQNIEPNWLDCNSTWGYYDEELGGWTGCVGKV